jgi:hypothetical protein
VPGGLGMMLKDLASPPPGMRGRDLDKIAKFSGDDENKREFYGMGAFPIDRSANPPLAVYEHRAFPDYAGITSLGSLTSNEWGKIAEIFSTRYITPFV